MSLDNISRILDSSLSLNFYKQLNETVRWQDICVYITIGGSTWVVYKFFIKPLLSPLRKIPGPPFKPIVGNMYDALRSEAMSNTLMWMEDYKSRVVRYYYLYGEGRVLVADPDLAKYISVTNSKNYVRRSSGNDNFGLPSKFLALISGQEHHAIRRLVNPAFNINTIESFVPTFAGQTEKVVSMWDERITENGNFAKVDAQLVISRLTLDLMCECGFDYKLNAVENPTTSGALSFSRILKGTRIRLIQMLPFFRYLPTKENKQNWEDQQLFTSTIKTMISKKRQDLKNTQGGADKSHKGDLMSVLLQAKDENGESLSDSMINDQIGGFFFAGYETTSTLLTWTLLLLAEHPDIQDKVRAEIMSVMLDKRTLLSMRLLDKMPYLTCVLKEALRLYAPLSNVFRRALRDDNFGGYFIPAGTVVGISITGLHRHPDNWDDPNTFKPERFLEEINPYKFQPFSSGPFMCIGHRFVMTEAKTILATLLRNFRFEMVPGYTYRRVRYLTVVPHPSLVLNVFRV